MEFEKKLVYEPPRLAYIADLKLVSGDNTNLVPGATQILPPDDDPDF